MTVLVEILERCRELTFAFIFRGGIYVFLVFTIDRAVPRALRAWRSNLYTAAVEQPGRRKRSIRSTAYKRLAIHVE
jgi:hypothetical protein